MGIEIFIRNPKGITLTRDGMEFLSYARQVVEQPSFWRNAIKSCAHRELFQRFLSALCLCSQCLCLCSRKVIWKNTSFSFVKLGLGRLSMTSRTSVVKSVSSFNSYNRDVLTKMLDDNHLLAHHLFTAQPHIFVSKTNLSSKKRQGQTG